jgi:hypothetical protein
MQRRSRSINGRILLVMQGFSGATRCNRNPLNYGLGVRVLWLIEIGREALASRFARSIKRALALVENTEISISGVALIGVSLIAMDLSHVLEGLKLKGVEPPQLILGVDVLRRWRAVIDYGSNSLWLAPDAAMD